MGHLLFRMTRKNKRVTAYVALLAMIGLLVLPIFLAIPALAGGGAPAAGGPPPDVVAAQKGRRGGSGRRKG